MHHEPGGPRGIEREKQVAAEAAAELVENGMTVSSQARAAGPAG